MADVLDPYEQRKAILEAQKQAFLKEKDDIIKKNKEAELLKKEQKVVAVKKAEVSYKNATNTEVKTFLKNRVTDIELDAAAQVNTNTGTVSKSIGDAYIERAKSRGPASVIAAANAKESTTKYTLEAEKYAQDATNSALEQLVMGTTAENKGKTQDAINGAVEGTIRGFKTAIYNEPGIMSAAVTDISDKLANEYNSAINKEYNKYDKMLSTTDQKLGKLLQIDGSTLSTKVASINPNNVTNSLTNLSTSKYGKYILPPAIASQINTNIQANMLVTTQKIATTIFQSTQVNVKIMQARVVGIQQKIVEVQKFIKDKQQLILNKIKAITDQIKAQVKVLTDKLVSEIKIALKISW